MLKNLIKKNNFRTWELETTHGKMTTPIFMPDATYGVVTALSSQDLIESRTEALVTTTLHIEQQISNEYLKTQGGLHKFMGWNKPILTDSGGFQVFLVGRKPQNN